MASKKVDAVPYSGIGSILGDEEIQAVKRAIASGDLCSGKILAEFEKAFADYVGVRHAVGVSNCTTALYLATQALHLKEGDEVITTPLTFIATSLPLLARNVK